MLFQVVIPDTESFVVNSSCKIGWGYPGKGAIYYAFDTSHTTIFFSNGTGIIKPVVGEQVSFDISLPYRFSIQYELDTGKTFISFSVLG